jgi:hypothetical protein
MAFNDATDDSVSDTFARLTKPKKQEKEPRVEMAEVSTGTKSDAGGGQTKPATTIGTPSEELLKLEPLIRKKGELEAQDAKMKEGQSAAEKARQAAIYEQYKPELTKKFETFQPTKDSLSSLASVGMMMMAIGSMGGKKGLTSATGAMNAIAGMATGYQQGRKEEFDRQKQIFEENYKIMKENQAQIEKEFQYALKYAKTDLTGAANYLKQQANARGDKTFAAAVDNKGVVGSINDQVSAARKGISTTKEELRKIGIDIEVQKLNIEAAKLAKTGDAGKEKELADYFNNNPTAVPTTDAAKIAVEKYGTPEAKQRVKLGKDAGKFEVEYNQVKDVIGDDVKKVPVTEIKQVYNKMDTAGELYEISQSIRNNPWAAGVLAKTVNAFDRLLINRYPDNKEVSGEFSNLSGIVSQDKSVFEGVPEDKISEARLIQKKVLDAINARALAANPQNRLLISELKMQKDVLDTVNMSAKTAADTYEGIADSELTSMKRRYKWKDETVDKLRKDIFVAKETEEQQALKWANEHPNDERAIEIKRRLGAQ